MWRSSVQPVNPIAHRKLRSCRYAGAKVPLEAFSPRVRDWFLGAFAAPTPAQALAWRTAEHLTKNWKAIANG